MKKLLPYILILVILVVSFGFAFTVTYAQNYTTTTPTATNLNTTQSITVDGGPLPTPSPTTETQILNVQPTPLQPLQSLPLSGTSVTPTTTTNTTSTTCTGTGLGKIICQLQQILNAIIPLLLALGVVYFVWGVVRFMISDAEEAKTKGKDQIIYGLVGLAVIISLWGLVAILVNTFHLGGQNAPAFNALVPSQSGGTSSASCSAGLTSSSKFQDYLSYFSICLINNAVVPFIFAIAVVMFIWGVVKFFIVNADEEAKREQGKQFMIWGIVALAVMLSVWGLVGVLSSTFGFDSVIPKVVPPGSSSSTTTP